MAHPITQAIPHARLNNGAYIPVLGFGTASGHQYTHQQTKEAITAAIQAGYRHFDTASLYNSEAALGDALSQAFKDGTLTRADVFVSSKPWCTETDDVLAAIKRSLSALQLDYLDLYLIHWPLKIRKIGGLTPQDIQPLDVNKTWEAMEKCVELGLTRSIGVSNFSSKKIKELLQFAKIPPAVNQVEMHPRWQQEHLREVCSKANIHVSAWGPLGAPNTRWGSHAVLDHPTIKEIASKHEKTPAQVTLRWALDQGVSVLPKSYNKTRMVENLQIFNWSLTQEDRDKIGKIEQQRNLSGPYLHDGSMYTLGLWDEEEA